MKELLQTAVGRIQRLATAVAAGALVWLGCSAVDPAPPVLETPAPAAYDEAPVAASAPPAAPRIAPDWWSGFGDPLLSALVAEGLEHNASLRAAAANVEMAFAQARIDGAAGQPELEAALDPGRRKQNTAQSGLTEAIPIPIPGFEPGGVRSFAFTSFGLALNVRWEVDLWGRLRALTAASLAEAAAGEADFEAARLSIAGQVAKLYFGVVEAVQQAELLERTLASRERTRDRVLARYRRGVATALEVRQARAQIAAVEASLAAQRQALDGLRRQLEVLLGRYPAGEIEAAAGLPGMPPLPAAGVPADLLGRRPDLRAAEYRAVASSERLRAARRALYPTFKLNGSAGASSGELADLLDGDFSVWSLAAGLLQPLLSGGRLRAGRDPRPGRPRRGGSELAADGARGLRRGGVGPGRRTDAGGAGRGAGAGVRGEPGGGAPGGRPLPAGTGRLSAGTRQSADVARLAAPVAGRPPAATRIADGSDPGAGRRRPRGVRRSGVRRRRLAARGGSRAS